MKNLDNKEERDNSDFPPNVIVLATHGSYAIPTKMRQKLAKSFDTRLIKNFSDSATRKVIEDIPTSQKVVAGFSRAVGDPNRSDDAEDLFREFDFNKNPVWEEPLSAEEKKWLIDNCYRKYHNRVAEIVENIEKKYPTVIIFDIHDTGERMLGEDSSKDSFREGGFPEITIANREGKSCDPQIMKDFAEMLKKCLGVDVRVNDPFKGGYMTQKYGEKYNDNLEEGEKFHRNVIQVELGRYLYMDETTQKIDYEKLEVVKEGLQLAMAEVGRKYL